MNNDKTVYIFRGLPGSGKSTKAKELPVPRRIVSADDFFMVDGVYRYDPSRIGEAHGQCMRFAIEHIQRHAIPLVIDNTNISNIEIAPYVLLAQAYGWGHKIIALHTTDVALVAECAVRNTHGVPAELVATMFERLLTELSATPSWWNQEIVEPAGVA